MNCREFVDFIMRYLDRELTDAERAEFDRHIADCPPCDVYLGQYRDTVRLAKDLCPDPEAELPAEVPEALVEAILAARARQP